MIYYLPLEHLEQRYTKHLDRDITEYLIASKKEFVRIYPEVSSIGFIKAGSFLDAPTTIEFKSKQISEIAKLYAKDIIKDGDIIFVSDLWMPGIESIAYLNYFCKKKVKIRGLLHAGSFTDTDFVRDMERWAKNFEDVIFDIVDKVYVGSEFIKNDVFKKRLIDKKKIVVTGFPLDYSGFSKYKKKKKDDIVIFNGRNVDEKQPWLFDELKKQLNLAQAVFINTQQVNLSKNDYYELLGRAKCVVSFALQENFGFGILEAVALGCVPVLPNRLVYPEFFSKNYLYDNFFECAKKVRKALNDELTCPDIKDFKQSIKGWFE